MLTASTPGAPPLARTFIPRLMNEALIDLKRLHLRLRSTHQLLPSRGWPQVDLARPAPSLQPHYRAFTATTSRSAPVPRIGTLPLAVSAAWGPPSRDPNRQTAPTSSGRRYRDDRFSCSMPAPATSSRHLYTGHHQGSTQAAPWLRARPTGAPLSRRYPQPPVSMPSFYAFDASAVVHTRSSSRRIPDPLTAGLFRSRFPPRLLTGMTAAAVWVLRLHGEPGGPTSITGTARFVLATFYILITSLSPAVSCRGFVLVDQPAEDRSTPILAVNRLGTGYSGGGGRSCSARCGRCAL